MRGSFLFTKSVKNEKGRSRFAFMVSAKHAPLAVTRNKVKRIFSEIIIKDKFLERLSRDILIVVTRKIEKADLANIGADLKEILSKL